MAKNGCEGTKIPRENSHPAFKLNKNCVLKWKLF